MKITKKRLEKLILEEIKASPWPPHWATQSCEGPDDAQVDKAYKMIRHSERIIFPAAARKANRNVMMMRLAQCLVHNPKSPYNQVIDQMPMGGAWSSRIHRRLAVVVADMCDEIYEGDQLIPAEDRWHKILATLLRSRTLNETPSEKDALAEYTLSERNKRSKEALQTEIMKVLYEMEIADMNPDDYDCSNPEDLEWLGGVTEEECERIINFQTDKEMKAKHARIRADVAKSQAKSQPPTMDQQILQRLNNIETKIDNIRLKEEIMKMLYEQEEDQGEDSSLFADLTQEPRAPEPPEPSNPFEDEADPIVPIDPIDPEDIDDLETNNKTMSQRIKNVGNK